MNFVSSRLVAAIAALLALAAPSWAQFYPSRSITLIVPFAPGGPADLLGRLIGQKLSEEFGQQVVVDNRSGANTIVGAQAVAKAKPDGYTLLLAIDGTLVMNPYLYASLPYDPFKDFVPVTQVAAVPSALTANIKVQSNTLKEVIDAEKAKPDGYTLLLAIDGTLVMNPYLYASLPYDPFKDFVPITQVAAVPSALTANIKVQSNTLKEVIDAEKAKPGTFQIGVSTPTSQVAIGLLNQLAGTKMTMVPYRGGTTQITGLLAGDIPLGHESVNVSLPLYRDKKIKIIALTGTKRLALAPELPIFAETFPGFDLGIWQSVVAPAGTPKEIVDKLYAGIKKVVSSQDVRDKLIAAGIEPVVSDSPEAFAAFVRSQADTRSKIIKEVGIKIE